MSLSNRGGRAFIGHSKTSNAAAAASVSFAGLAYVVLASTPVHPSAVVASTSAAVTTDAARQSRGDPWASFKNLDIEVREPENLRDVLRRVPELAGLVVDVVGVLQKAFGDRARIAIDPYIDPELADAETRVIIVAVTGLAFEQADAVLDSVLESKWWADNQSRANYLVSLATELV